MDGEVMERSKGFEPLHSVWKTDVLAIEHQPRLNGIDQSRDQSFQLPPIPPPVLYRLSYRHPSLGRQVGLEPTTRVLRGR